MAVASTLAVLSASEPCRRGSLDEHRLGRAHRQRGAQARRLAVGRHRDQADLAAAGRVDELQRHLDAVAVGLVEDQLALALERCSCRDPARPVRPDLESASRRRRRSWAAMCCPSHSDGQTQSQRCLAVVRYTQTVRVLLVVNSFASSVTARNHGRDPTSALAPTTTSQSSRPAVVVTPRGLRRTPHSAESTLSWRFGGDGTLNEVANGLAGTDCGARLATRRLDQRLRPHDRHAQRPRRSHRRAASTRSTRGQCAASASARSTAATSASTRASATTPPSSARSRSGPRSSGGSGHPLFIYAALSHVVLEATTGAARTSSCRAPGRAVRCPTVLHRRAEHQPLHLPRQPPLRPRPAPPSTTGSRSWCSVSCTPSPFYVRWP